MAERRGRKEGGGKEKEGGKRVGKVGGTAHCSASSALPAPHLFLVALFPCTFWALSSIKEKPGRHQRKTWKEIREYK